MRVLFYNAVGLEAPGREGRRAPHQPTHAGVHATQESRMTSRRQFFVRGAAATVAAFTPDVLLAAVRQHSAPAPDLSSWSAVRAQFDLAPDWIHLSTFFFSSHPKPVRDAIAA